MFDFFGTGTPIHVAWTLEGTTNGWLALDRNGNGVIDSARELFGNITAQPSSVDKNGFLALAVFDRPENGGNGDGIIDGRDAVWSKLLVWIDRNHDGISQASELKHLEDLGIHSISLGYVQSDIADKYGNTFRYRGHLNPIGGDRVGRVIYDVFLSSYEGSSSPDNADSGQTTQPSTVGVGQSVPSASAFPPDDSHQKVMAYSKAILGLSLMSGKKSCLSALSTGGE